MSEAHLTEATTEATRRSAADLIKEARRRSGLTQRQLASRSGVAQPVIARIESGRSNPAFETVEKLLSATGMTLEIRQVVGSEPGAGVDRTLIRGLLPLTPDQRLRHASDVANNLARFLASAKAPPGTLPPSVEARRAARSAVTDPLLDAPRAIATLAGHGVRFVVIGGMAARLHGSPSITEDLDICYARDPENFGRLAAALLELKARLRGAPEDVSFKLDAKTLEAGDHFTFVTTAGWLDCLGIPAGSTGFEQLRRRAVTREIQGHPILVTALEDLLRMKRAAGRAKDRIELEVLEALRDELEQQGRQE